MIRNTEGIKLYSVIDPTILITVYYNGYHLSRGGIVGSPLELIADPIQRKLVMAEAKQKYHSS